jgi:hypothetical protein
MADSEKQAAFVAGLRKLAEQTAANNPSLSDMRTLAKMLVAETRAKIESGEPHSPLGAYMENEGGVSIIRPEGANRNRDSSELLSKLKNKASEGQIRAAALSEVIDKPIPGGSVVRFVQVHMEHSAGRALISGVPVNESDLRPQSPEVQGPAVNVFGGPTKPKIFPPRT